MTVWEWLQRLHGHENRGETRRMQRALQARIEQRKFAREEAARRLQRTAVKEFREAGREDMAKKLEEEYLEDGVNLMGGEE